MQTLDLDNCKEVYHIYCPGDTVKTEGEIVLCPEDSKRRTEIPAETELNILGLKIPADDSLVSYYTTPALPHNFTKEEVEVIESIEFYDPDFYSGPESKHERPTLKKILIPFNIPLLQVNEEAFIARAKEIIKEE